MIDERHEELASLHALDLLEGTERLQFETAVAANPELRALVDDLRDAAAALAHLATVAPAPAALRARVLASIGAPTAGRIDAPDNVVRVPASRFRQLLPWFAAACFAMGAGWLAQFSATSRRELSAARTQVELAGVALQSARNQLEAERILAARQLSDLNTQVAETGARIAAAQQAQAGAERERLLAEQAGTGARQQLATATAQLSAANQQLTLASTEIVTLSQQLKAQGELANFKITTLASLLNNSPQALAVAVWDPSRQEGVLQVEKLPALAADKSYQLWVVDPQYPAPVDGGVFTVDPAGGARVAFKSRQPVKTINAFAVTLERKGGVPKAEGPFVLLGK